MEVPGDPEQSTLDAQVTSYVLLPIILFLVCLRIASQFPFKNKATNQQIHKLQKNAELAEFSLGLLTDFEPNTVVH